MEARIINVRSEVLTDSGYVDANLLGCDIKYFERNIENCGRNPLPPASTSDILIPFL
jgi:hypothetical protein